MSNPFFIALVAIVIIIVVVALYMAKKERTSKSIIGTETIGSDNTELHIAETEKSNLITIPIQQLPALTEFENGSLFEIKDRAVLSRISQTFPFAVQTATNTVVQNIAQKALNNPQMYMVKIPAGTKLTDPTKKGIQYAFYKGSKGGSAQLVKPDFSKMTNTTAIANGVANVMNIGSMVVGQYYMAEISAKLEAMSNNIDKISDFQDREFKSRILSAITLVGEVSDFSTEIIENDEQRQRKLSVLEGLKATATELLGQVNITIADVADKSPNPDYKGYLSKVSDFAMLVGYQNALLAVLEEISKLTYLLGKGSLSSEISYATYEKYLRQAVQTRGILTQWHDKQVKLLKIDLDNERVAKSGLEAFVAVIPSLINETYKTKDLEQGFAQAINVQTQSLSEQAMAPMQVYDKDVEIVVNDGKYYYLLDKTNEVMESDGR